MGFGWTSLKLSVAWRVISSSLKKWRKMRLVTWEVEALGPFNVSGKPPGKPKRKMIYFHSG